MWPAPQGYAPACRGSQPPMAFILFLIAAALVIYGIVRIFQGEVLLGIVLIVVGLLVGPGGYSIFGSLPLPLG